MGQNTVEILSSINKLLTQVVQNTSSQNKKSENVIKKINQGNVIEPAQSESKGVNVSTGSISGVVKSLAQLPPVVKSIAGLSGKTTKNFEKVIESIVSVTKRLNEAASQDYTQIKKYTDDLGTIANSVHVIMKKMSSAVVLAPIALVGIMLSVPVFIAFAGLLKLITSLGSFLSEADSKKMQEYTKSLDSVMGFMMKASLLVGICLGMGVLLMLGNTGKIVLGGLIAFAGVMLVTIAVMAITGKASNMAKEIGGKALKDMMFFIGGMVLLTAVLFGFGAILMNVNTGKYVLGGLIAFTAVMLVTLAVVGITALAAKWVKDFGTNALKDIMFFTVGMLIITGALFGFGAILMNGDTGKLILGGLIGFAATMVVMISVIGISALAAKWITETKAIDSLWKMMAFAGTAMLMVVASKYLGDMVLSSWDSILAGFGATAAVMLALVGIAVLVSMVKSTVIQGVATLAIVVGLAVAAIGIVYLALKLSDEAKGKWGQITLALVAVTGVLLAFVALAAAATFAAPYIAPGAAALLLVAGFAIGAVLVVQKIVEFQKFKEESGVEWSDVIANVVAIAGVIGVFGVLATAMGVVSPFVALGSIAILPLNLFVIGAISIVKRLIEFSASFLESGVNWDVLGIDLKNLATTVAVFGVLATAMGLVMPFVTLGTIAMLPLNLFVVGATIIMKTLVDFSLSIKESGLSWIDYAKDIAAMATTIGAFSILASALTLVLPFVAVGTLAILPLNIFVAGSLLIMKNLVDFSLSIKESGLSWIDYAKDIAAMATTIGAFSLLASALTVLLPFVTVGTLAILPLNIFVAGSLLIMKNLVDFSLSIKESGLSWGSYVADIAAMATTIGAFSILASALTVVLPFVTVGSLAILPLNLFVAGAVSMVNMLVGFSTSFKDSGVSWLDLASDIAVIATTIGALSLIATAISVLAIPVTVAAVAILPLNLFVAGATSVVQKLVGFSTSFKDSGVSWLDLASDIAVIATVVGSLSLIAGAMSLAIIPITMGMGAMFGVNKFVSLVTNTIKNLSTISTTISEIGKDNIINTLNKDVKSILGAVNSDNFDVPIGLLGIAKLTAKHRSVEQLVHSFMLAAKDLCKIAVIGNMIDGEGRISPQIGTDNEGNPIYGDPVDIVHVSTTIMSSIKAFTSVLDSGLLDVDKMKDAKKSFGILASIVDPISRFLNLLTGFVGGTDKSGDATLTPVKIDDKGNIIKGAPCKVVVVAKSIVSAVDSFVGTLFAPSVIEKWQGYINGSSGRKQKKAVTGVMGVLGEIVDPINALINLLTGYDGDGTTISTVSMDSNGKVVKGPSVDPKKIATSILNSVSSFVDTIFNKNTMKKWEDAADYDSDIITTLKSQIENLVQLGASLSNDNIKPDLIKSNGLALGSIFNDVFGNVTDDLMVTAETMQAGKSLTKGKVSLYGSFAKLLELSNDLSNVNVTALGTKSKAITSAMAEIFGYTFNSAIPKVQELSKHTGTLTANLKDFDKTLMSDSNRRKKAIDEFKDSIEELLKKFSNAGDSVHELYELVTQLEHMDGDKISDNISKINTKKGGTSTTQNDGTSTTQNKQNTQTSQSIDADTLASAFEVAIRNALAGMTIKNTDSASFATGSGTIDDVVTAISEISYKVEI